MKQIKYIIQLYIKVIIHYKSNKRFLSSKLIRYSKYETPNLIDVAIFSVIIDIQIDLQI